MKIGYLILAHQNLTQVERLIDRLYTEDTRFYVHVDSKCEEEMPKDTNSITWISFHDIAWGSYTMVEATLELLNLSHCDKNRWHILLSGTHYPIKDNNYIMRHLKKQEANAIIESNKIKVEEHPTIYHAIRDFNFHPQTSAKFVIHIAPLLSRRFFTRRNIRQVLLWLKYSRQVPRSIFSTKRVFPPTRKGCQWWCIDAKSAQHLLCQNIKSKWNYTHVPDEMCIQTILGTSALRITNTSMTYTRWGPFNSGSPETIKDYSTIEAAMKSSNFLFARKFEATSPIFEAIDRKLDNYEL